MKNFLKNIIALILLGIAIFIFRDSLLKSYFTVQDKYFPCTRTITYSIGTFDENFNITKKDFLNSIKEGENMWETIAHKDLLKYLPEGGELKINLIYDNRQESTLKLKNINESLEYNQSSYDSLKNEVDNLKNEFEQKKAILESKIISLRDNQGSYTKENIAEINRLQVELNNYVKNINSLVDKLNKSASSFNNQAKVYNNIGNNLGEEFEEGLYHSDKNGKYIDIYQFENKDKLTRVLMHELGHALSVDHVDDPKAIMYRLNTEDSLMPTNDDINALRTYCGMK